MKFYVTTAIAYVNDRPGLHHAYEFTGADALARFHRQRGDEVFFLTGTDENATKNEEAARTAGMETRAFVDRNAAEFRRLCDTWNISYDRFMRTSDADHIHGVQEFVRRWVANDDVYLATYEGWYCSRCEAFYEESDLKDGRCEFHPSNPDAIQRVSEENYFFRLTKYADRLKALYAADPDFTVPDIRRNEVLGWLDLPAAERPTFMMLYFEDTDTAGHDHDPDSREVREAIMRLDAYLGRLLRGLERRGLHESVNVVLVSDHGMSATNDRRVVVLDDYISLDDVEIVDINPTLGLYPNPGKNEEVYRALVNAHPRLKVYRREETPEHWHYRDHPRIPPIVGVVDDGWQVLRRATVLDIVARKITGAGSSHGYDPMSMSMRGVFVAAGPAFKQGVTVPAFENVSIYNTLAQVLGVTPAKNDGDPAIARSLLR